MVKVTEYESPIRLPYTPIQIKEVLLWEEPDQIRLAIYSLTAYEMNRMINGTGPLEADPDQPPFSILEIEIDRHLEKSQIPKETVYAELVLVISNLPRLLWTITVDDATRFGEVEDAFIETLETKLGVIAWDFLYKESR